MAFGGRWAWGARAFTPHWMATTEGYRPRRLQRFDARVPSPWQMHLADHTKYSLHGPLDSAAMNAVMATSGIRSDPSLQLARFHPKGGGGCKGPYPRATRPVVRREPIVWRGQTFW